MVFERNGVKIGKNPKFLIIKFVLCSLVVVSRSIRVHDLMVQLLNPISYVIEIFWHLEHFSK